LIGKHLAILFDHQRLSPSSHKGFSSIGWAFFVLSFKLIEVISEGNGVKGVFHERKGCILSQCAKGSVQMTQNLTLETRG
jgi:hypothetical protein